jgi:SP family sugar:H+ symporter-like MFS transporter
MATVIARLRENPMAIVVSAFAAFGGFLYGYDTGTISGIIAMNYFKQTFGVLQANGQYILPSASTSLIVSILSAGTFFGALLGYPASDFLGRRWGLILACAIFSVGVVFQTAASSLPLFVVGRVVAGLGVGIISCIVPMYQSECAPKWIRGLIVSGYQWFITIGLLIAAIVNNGTKDINSYACYRIPIGIQLIWASILAIGMFILPESPRYLIMKGRIERAYHSQARLNSTKIDDPKIDAEVKEIVANMELLAKYGTSTYLDCFKMGPQKNLLRTLVGIFLQAWQQLTGINFIFYYGTTFFSTSGIAAPFLLTIATNVVNVGMTIPGMLLIDKLGRRKILIIGAAGMLTCEYIVAIIGTIFGQSNDSAQKTLIAFVCIYIAFFASTWGPAAWVVTGEIYPLAIRAKCMSLSSASNWLFNFALGYATPYMIDPDKGNLGPKVFFVWGSTCLGCLLFAIFCIWETKGLSLEQVDYLVRNSSPIQSATLNTALRSNSLLEGSVIGDAPQDFTNNGYKADVEISSVLGRGKIGNENINNIINDEERL